MEFKPYLELATRTQDAGLLELLRFPDHAVLKSGDWSARWWSHSKTKRMRSADREKILARLADDGVNELEFKWRPRDNAEASDPVRLVDSGLILCLRELVRYGHRFRPKSSRPMLTNVSVETLDRGNLAIIRDTVCRTLRRWHASSPSSIERTSSRITLNSWKDSSNRYVRLSLLDLIRYRFLDIAAQETFIVCPCFTEWEASAVDGSVGCEVREYLSDYDRTGSLV